MKSFLLIFTKTQYHHLMLEEYCLNLNCKRGRGEYIKFLFSHVVNLKDVID